MLTSTMTVSELDLFRYPVSRKDFRVQACIDWLELSIHIARPTQFRYLQEAFERAGCGKLSIDARTEAPGGVADTFVIRIHDELANDVAALRAKLGKVSKDYQIVGEPALVGIEVSCDFWHKGEPSRHIRDTLAMTFRLQSSLFATGTKPRVFVPTGGEQGTVRFLDVEGARLDPGGTFYVGNKHDDLMWRVYFKSTDSGKHLPESLWRARVEVRIKGAALKELGLRGLTDLQGYRFQRLAPLFRFRRPVPPEKLAAGNKFKLASAKAARKVNDATPARGIHSFAAIGRIDKWRKRRRESLHIEADQELQDAVKGALRRLSL